MTGQASFPPGPQAPTLNVPTASDNSSASSPNTKFPHPILAIVLVVVSFFAASFVAEVAVSLYPLSQHWSNAQSQHWLDTNTAVQFAFTLLAYTLMLIPIVLYMRRYGITRRDIGLTRPRMSDVGWGLLALPLYFISYGIIVSVVSGLVPGLNVDQKQQIGFQGASGTDALILTFVSLAIIPPFAEEFLMRGFLFTSLRARTKMLAAVLITSVVFAAGHLQFGSGAPLLWVAALDTFTLSLFLIYLRVKTNSLWASIALHALKNTIAFVVIFVFHKG